MSEILKNIYISYSTEPTYFLVTAYGILMIYAGVFNVKWLVKILSKLGFYDYPNMLWRSIAVIIGIIITVVTIVAAARIL